MTEVAYCGPLLGYLGVHLYGFCNGFFGRDSYGTKTIINIGKDWIVALEDGYPVVAIFDLGWADQMEEYILKWAGDEPMENYNG